MANMCSNTVWFQGSYEDLKPLYDLLIQYDILCSHHREIDLSQYPPKFEEFNWYTSDYYIEDSFEEFNDSFYIEFLTRWAPRPECIVKLAEHYKLDFTYAYEEGSNEYGEFKYENGIIMNRCLDELETKMLEGKHHFNDGLFELFDNYLETKLWIPYTLNES